MSDARRDARGARFDEVIDRAVREMLDVEPRPDMRARVIARVNARAASFRLPVSSFQGFAALASAAAVLVLVLVLARRSEPPAQPPVQARAGADEILPAPQPVVPKPIAPAARTQVARVLPRGMDATATDAPSAAPGIDPLKTIAPIEVAPIAQSSITPEPIGVASLSPIPEMQIAPLNPPDRRN